MVQGRRGVTAEGLHGLAQVAKRSSPSSALRRAARSANSFWNMSDQLPIDMSTSSASTNLATSVAWPMIWKKLFSILTTPPPRPEGGFSGSFFMVCVAGDGGTVFRTPHMRVGRALQWGNGPFRQFVT